MASSIRKAQAPLSCQLCDNPTVIKWKCKECMLLMCDNCKERVHPKFKSSETHTIISIKEVGKEKNDVLSQFGSLQVSQKVISSVLSTYTTHLPSIGKMQYSSDDTIYLSCCRGDVCEFLNVRLLKKSMKVLKRRLDIECTDFDLNSKNEIHFEPLRGSGVHVTSLIGVKKIILDPSPMLVMAIHINRTDGLILGLREQGPPFPVTQFCTRQIVVFGENNQRALTIEHDQSGKKIFSYIWRLKTDSDNNIYAIDQFENYDGRLVALEITGEVKFIYEGHSSVKTPQTPFNPMGIVITGTNNIIVSDSNNNYLHALNKQGNLIGLQKVADLGIERPYSLCFDSEGFLLVGCSVKEGSGAKIHVATTTL